MAKRKRYSRVERQEWVLRWRSSGLPAGQFAARHGMKVASLYRWGHEFPASPQGTGASEEFAEIRVRELAEPRSRAALEVVLRSDRVIRISGEVDATVLRTIVEVLESC